MYVYGSATSALTLHTLSSFLCNVPVFMLPKAHVSGCVNTVQYEVCVCVCGCVCLESRVICFSPTTRQMWVRVYDDHIWCLCLCAFNCNSKSVSSHVPLLNIIYLLNMIFWDMVDNNKDILRWGESLKRCWSEIFQTLQVIHFEFKARCNV